jgi:spore germination protein GerM
VKQKQTKKKSKKGRKGEGGKLILLFVLIGIGVFVYSYRNEIVQRVQPWMEKRGVVSEKKRVLLYFSDREGDYLIGEKREISKREDVEEEAEETIRELIRGPKGKLIPTLPSQTKILGVELDEKGVAKVNFSKALSKNHPGGSSAEMMTVYSVVNSLTLNFPEIKRVQFLVEGKGIESITGHLSLKQSLSSKTDLIKKTGKRQGDH